MSLRLAGSLALFVGALALMVSLPSERLVAQYAQPSLVGLRSAAWENDRLRVRTVSVNPGARLTASEGGADRVVVFLTADLDGRMPAAEAIWQPAGGPEAENRGRLRAEAVVVDLKPSSASQAGGTPLETLSANDIATARVLIDNPRVAVLKMRYRPYPLTLDVPHAHPQDALVVYLSGGSAWLPFGGWGYPVRVRRGEFDVIPAHTFHSFGNAGGDNLEFLVILPK